MAKKPNNSKNIKFKSKSNKKQVSTVTKIKNKAMNASFKGKNKPNTPNKNNADISGLFNSNISNLTVKNKAKIVNKLRSLIISFPEEQIEKLPLIISLLKDSNIKIVDYCLKTLGKIFKDITPTYNLYKNELQIEKGKNFSKPQINLQNFESKILIHLDNYLNCCEVLLGSEISLDIKLSILKSLSSFNNKYFNISLDQNNFKILSIFAKQLYSNLKDVRKTAFKYLDIFLQKFDNSKFVLELKFKLLNNISYIIYNKSDKLDEECINLLNSHRIEIPEIDFNKKKKSKIEKEVDREVKEYENVTDNEQIYNYNLKYLKIILGVYFEFIKNRSNHYFIPNILSNIQKQIQFINVEILADLQRCINKLIKDYLKTIQDLHLQRQAIGNNNKNKKEAIKSEAENTNNTENTSGIKNETINSKLNSCYIKMLEACLLCIKTNNVLKDAISKGEVIFENADMLNNLFILIGLLKKFVNLLSNDLIRDLLEIITIYFVSSRQYNMEITMAFTKKITLLVPFIEKENVAFSFMLLLNKLFGMYPFLRDLLDKSEEDYFNDKTNDVSLSNGKNANCLKDLQEISKKSEKLKNFVNDIINKKNSSTKYMMNYYDVLLADNVTVNKKI